MASPNLAQSFAIRQGDFTSDMVDGEVIIVNLTTGTYYSLTEMAAEIWTYLQAELSLGQMIERVQAIYQEDRAKITDWLSNFLGKLQEENLVIPSPSARAPNSLPLPDERTAKRGSFLPPELRKYTDLKDMVLMSYSEYQHLTS